MDNFFQPKERGIATIRTFSRLLPSSKSSALSELRPEEVGNLIESALVSAFDFARISTKEGISRFLSIVERIPELHDFFRNAPDVREMLVSLIPELIGSVERKDFAREIGTYVKRVSPHVLAVVDGMRAKNPERQDTALLATLSETTALVSRLLNEKNSETIFSAVKRLSITKEHPVLSRLVRVLDDPGIAPATRLKFARKLLDGANILTEPKLDEAKLTKFGDELFSLLAVIRNESKQPARISALIIEISNLLLNKQESTTPLGNYDIWEAFKLLFVDNREQVFEIWKRYREGSIKTVNDVIRFIVEGNMLQENVRMANGALFRRLKEIGDFNISQAMQNFRTTYLQKLHVSTEETAKSKERQTGSPLVAALRESFAKNGTSFLSDAIRAGREVRTDEISRLVLTSVAGAIRSNRVIFTREFTSLGIVLPQDPKELDQQLQKLASNPIVIQALTLAIRENGPKFASEPKSLTAILEALTTAFASEKTKSGKPTVDLRASLIRSVTDAFYDSKDASSRTEAINAALAFAPADIRKLWDAFPPAQKEGLCQAFSRTFDRTAATDLLGQIVSGSLTSDSALSFLVSRGDLRATLSELHASGVLRLMFAPSAKTAFDWKTLAASYPQLLGLRTKIPDSEMQVLQPYLGVSMEQFRVIDRAFRSFPADLVAKTLRDPVNKAVLDAIVSDGIPAVLQGKERPAFLRLLATLAPKASPDDVVRAARVFLPNNASNQGLGTLPKLLPEEASHLAAVMFHALKSPQSASLIDSAIPSSIQSDARFRRLSDTFGKSIGTQARDLLESLGKDQSVRIFLAHQEFLSNALGNDLSADAMRDGIVRIVADIVRSVDPKELGKRFSDGSPKDPAIRTVVSRTPALLLALKETHHLEDFLFTGVELAERFPYPAGAKIDTVEREKIRSYGEKAFDVFGRFISHLGPGEFETFLAEMPVTDNKTLPDQLKSSFISKNFGFVLSNVFPVVFGGQTTEKSIAKYFSDPSNRENFGKTCWHVVRNYRG